MKIVQFGAFFLGRCSPFSSLNSLPNTSKNLRFLCFLNNQKVVFLYSFSSPWSQDLGYEVLRVQMQLFSYNLHPLLYFCSQHVYWLSIVCLYFILLPSMFYSLFSMSPCFLPCFATLMLLAQPSCVRICLNFVFVL